jgi:hypothetical protein
VRPCGTAPALTFGDGEGGVGGCSEALPIYYMSDYVCICVVLAWLCVSGASFLRWLLDCASSVRGLGFVPKIIEGLADSLSPPETYDPFPLV